MSMPRVWLEAAWEQPGSRLEYAYSMLMTTFLRPFSSKRAELERRLAANEITARPSRDYGSYLTRLRLVMSLLLMLIVGSSSVWGQDHSGVYYIASVNYDGNPANTNNYYLCPTEGWCYYQATDDFTGTDNGMPFLTTYRCKTNDYHSGNSNDAIWIIEKAPAPNSSYYYIRQASTGKYLTSNGTIRTTGNADRMRVHVETIAPENLDDKELFTIAEYSTYLTISPKGVVGGAVGRSWLTVNNGNYNSLQGASGKTGGPTGYANTTGIIGVYTQNDANGKFYLEEALSIDAPTITNNNDGTFTITAASGATIYYTTDGSTPTTTSYMGTGTTSVNIDQTESMTVIKAIAKVTSDPFPTIVTTYYLPVCEKPIISVSDGIVTITSTTEGATIHYTTDGSPATSASTVYTGPFAKGDASTFRAIAAKPGYVTSNEVILLPPTEVSSSSQITNMNGSYILASNFTSSGSIGTADNPFKGIINGNLNTLTLGYPLVAYADGATIKNVILNNVNISSSNDNDNGNAGAICCEATGDTRIYNCGVLSGSVGGGNNVGGIVGLLDGRARVINCYNYAEINSGSNCGGIVGYNNVASTSNNLQTMVMNCMNYGSVTGGNAAPIYGGAVIHNKYASADDTGLNNYCYFLYDEEKVPYVKTIADDKYNGALGAEERFLNRFEFFRMTLNSTRNLAAFYVTGDANQKDEMAKWVLDKSIAPYPILKAQAKYPSVVNPDAVHATAQTERNKGGLLGTLDVTISGVGSGAVFSAPSGATITNGSLQLNITDKDYDNFNYNYRKVQLPYYNEVGTGNYTKASDGTGRVVTGWKITSITGGTPGSFKTDTYDYPSFNFVDRKCTNKDLYGTNGSNRVFAQGAYWEVPDGVTAIEIEPYWAKAVYLSDANYDMTYNISVSGSSATANKYGVTVCGSCPTTVNGQTVYNDITTATNNLGSNASHTTVYDYAVVLVGNYHQAANNAIVSIGKPLTFMSADLDGDNEPDNTLFYYHNQRKRVSEIRFDFLNIPGIGMVKRTHDATTAPEPGIFKPQGWFEITNTALIHCGQFEYAAGGSGLDKTILAPLILQGGVYEQFVSGMDAAAKNTNYILIGSNAWFKNFANGCHTKNAQKTPKVPINVAGGDYTNFYLTGIYQPAAAQNAENAECYIDGGRFSEVAGSGMQQVNGNVTWLINAADITSFFGGGINAAKPVTGSISTTISNSYVDEFYGGPKFGDMSNKKTVTTNATDCHFGKFFGAGYGGTAYNRVGYVDDNSAENTRDWDGYVDTHYGRAYSADNKGISTNYEYEFIPHSDGKQTVARFFVNYASLSLASTRDVTNTLSGCTIGTFYGGGSLGAVNGNINSTLTNCKVTGSTFGAGFSASVPTVEVWNKSAYLDPNPTYNRTANVYNNANVKTPKDNNQFVVYTWSKEHGTNDDPFTDTEDGKHYIHTDVSLEGLGAVTGNVTLTIDGNTVADENGKVMKVEHSVYGGGEESAVNGNTSVTVTGGTIGTANEGGAEYGNVYGGGKGKEDDVTAGIVKGSTTVSISGSPAILHNVYGGGAYGSVGTFSYDASGFPTGWTTTDNKGKCTVSITGGTIGTTGDNNGMVFGSSRGLEGNPEADANVDKMAWVYDTDVTIGTQNAESNANPWIKGSVYGGGENGHNFHDAKVTVHSGTIGITEGSAIVDDGGTPDDDSDDISYSGARYPNRGNVYGSGCGTDTYTGTDSKTYFDFNAGIVRGNTTVLIDGGHVVHNVYGGGAMGSVGTYTFDANGKPTSCAEGSGTCTVTVSGGKIGVAGAKMTGYGKGGPDDFGHVFGAGRGEMHDPNLYPNVETCAFFNKTILEIKGTAFLTGSVYGGSESGHVLGDTDVTISGGQIGCGREATAPFDNLVWADDYVPTASVNLDCASWPFTAPFAPYDPFANESAPLDKYPNGESTDGGRLAASDGHTYYGNVFGGGSGSVPYFDETAGISKYLSTAGSVEGKTKVTISGGHILTNVYGGCEATNVKGSATIKMTGGTVGVPRTVAQIVAHPLTGYIFGAGKGDQRIFFNKETNVDRTFVNIEGGRVYGSIFGGGEDGHVFQNTTVTIGKDDDDTEGPTIGTWGTSYVDGNVFGGGRGFGGEALTAGNIGGSVELNIKSGRILGSVYGGGRLASVGYGLYLTSEEGYGILRPNDKYDGSYPNPSTQEASAYYNNGRGYITINISGGTIGNDAEYIFEPSTEEKAAIPYTKFDYQNHLQYTKGGNVFTGGMGRLYALDNTTLLTLWPKLGKCKETTLNMTGGTVKSSIYGGGEIGAVAKNATVNINGGTVGTKVVHKTSASRYYYFGSVFGGGKGSVDNITYPDGTADPDKIPISEAGTTGGNVEVNLNKTVASNDAAKGAIVNQIFGCNDMNGSPKGTVTVHVYATQNADKDKISAKYEKGKEKFDVMAVYGGGNLAAYEPTDLSTGKTNVIIDGCGLTSIRQVYGGGNAASTPATDVEINGTYEILELFGGGNGFDKLPNGDPNPGANVGYRDYHLVENNSEFATKEARVDGAAFESYRYGTGEATVNIKGGTIHRVFGGSNTKGNVRKSALTMLEEVTEGGEPKCPFCVDEAYGGGKSAPMDAEAKLLMACIPGLNEVYGGAEAADIHDDVTLTITNGNFNRVFGGNNISGTISGKITVNVEETGCRPVIIGELYGGGNLAAYSKYGYNDDGTPKESGENPSDDPVVNVRSFTSIGAVYGGGYGTGARMIADPTVNINESVGTPDNYPTTGDYDTNGFKGKTIKFDEGLPTEHTVTLPAHTKEKMGAIGDVFGGGNAAEVTGNTTVNIGTSEYDEMVSIATGDDVTGYYIRNNDGSYTEATGTAVEGTTYYKKVLGVDIRGNVYGGGNNAAVTGNTNVNIGKRVE